MNKKHIVLFDMDGTLTEPRKQFDKRLLTPLRELSLFSEIGILTGSDHDYLFEQKDKFNKMFQSLVFCISYWKGGLAHVLRECALTS